ncbi:hypothetical protein VN97_g10152 [Penicillium thymicola]|uniref:Uncharacterized protein n=1 Tax=Penicillium thymicola TaxID=293382 RepID=A0AAI9TAB9_PENTH|nr:hypothetical protein VN97_g10152 [Penicillium thymicola]
MLQFRTINLGLKRSCEISPRPPQDTRKLPPNQNHRALAPQQTLPRTRGTRVSSRTGRGEGVNHPLRSSKGEQGDACIHYYGAVPRLHSGHM